MAEWVKTTLPLVRTPLPIVQRDLLRVREFVAGEQSA